MNTDSRRGDSGCRKARPRLSLLAGGELTGDERRAVEQHLITCPDCRARLASLRKALQILRTTGSFERTQERDAPSLWPALRRQIVEAKHAPRPSPIAALSAWIETRRFGFAPRPRWITTAAALGLLATGVALWSHRQADEAQARVAEARQPLPPDPTARHLPLPPPTGPLVAEAHAPTPPPGEANASRFQSDLAHGTPKGPDAQDSGTGAY
ncbi:MAG: anti-sigma factor [Isosphaeraceae bacterium]